MRTASAAASSHQDGLAPSERAQRSSRPGLVRKIDIPRPSGREPTANVAGSDVGRWMNR